MVFRFQSQTFQVSTFQVSQGKVEKKIAKWVEEAPGRKLAVIIGLQYTNAIVPILQRYYHELLFLGKDYLHGDFLSAKRAEIQQKINEADTIHVYVVATSAPSVVFYLSNLLEMLTKTGKLISYKYIDVITYGEVVTRKEVAQRVVKELAEVYGIPSDTSWVDPETSRIVSLLDVVESFPSFEEIPLDPDVQGGKIPVVLVSRHLSDTSYFDIPKQDEDFRKLFDVRGVLPSSPSLPSDIKKWLDEIERQYGTRNVAFAGIPTWIHSIMNQLGSRIFLPKTLAYRPGEPCINGWCKAIAGGKILLKYHGWAEYVWPHTLSVNWERLEQESKAVIELTNKLVNKYL